LRSITSPQVSAGRIGNAACPRAEHGLALAHRDVARRAVASMHRTVMFALELVEDLVARIDVKVVPRVRRGRSGR